MSSGFADLERRIMARVVILRCEGYAEHLVVPVVRKGIDMLGGPSVFARPGEKILLKPNWLAADPPEKCSTTHPVVFKAVCMAFKDTGAKFFYGDSPAMQRPEIAAKKSGFEDVAKEFAVTPADFQSGKNVFVKNGLQNKKFTIANGVLACDGLISLPKLKTHGFQLMTGAVKNQFGCIPGVLKGEFHVKTPDADDFAKMLIDLNSYINPRLYIMDAIIAMEGNGPRGGKPKQLNVLLFSTDPVALDATACRIIGLKPELVPTNKAGQEAGAWTYNSDAIELLGDPIEDFIDLKFDIKREPVKPFKAEGLMSFIKNALVPRPYIVSEKCIKCGICIDACPVSPKAIVWHDKNKALPPSYNYRKCIRCYCCQEMCPQSAIRLKTPVLRKLYVKINNLR